MFEEKSKVIHVSCMYVAGTSSIIQIMLSKSNLIIKKHSEFDDVINLYTSSQKSDVNALTDVIKGIRVDGKFYKPVEASDELFSDYIGGFERIKISWIK